MEAFHKIKVNSPYEILEIEDIKISNKPNEHGYLYLRVLVDENINFKYAVEASTDDKICIYEETENEEKIIIFNGTIQNIKTSNENRLYYMEIEAYASSFAFDIEEKSRSFQDSEMSYDNLINTILLDYKIYSFTQCMDRPMSIGKPLFQYKETDYEFLRRVASHLGLELNSDIINTGNAFYFGRPSGRSYEIEEDIDYTASMDIKKYKKSSVHNSDIHPTDFFYYEIKTAKVMEIGAKVVFRQKDLYVYSYEAEYVRGELIYTYRLCREKGIWQEKLYNDKLKGISLEGRVMEVSGEQVKLHLNIDETQNQTKAAWFRYAPPTGNLMYSMPIVGTNANLYFPSERSEEPMVIGCVRKNGGSCEKFSDVNNRYFATESGNNLDLLPGAINFSRPGLSANFNDGSGITLSSSSSLSINAGYVGMFAGNISIEANSKLEAKRCGSSLSLEDEFYNDASIVMENGSDRASNEPFDDDPQKGAQEVKAAIEASAQFAVGALAGAVEGAIGKIGDFSSLTNSVESKSDNSESGKKSALESVMDFLFPPTTCYAAERNGAKSNTQNDPALSDSKTDQNSDVPSFISSGQYIPGQEVTAMGGDGKLYSGTAEFDGYIGTGGYRKFKFVPDDPDAFYNSRENGYNEYVEESYYKILDKHPEITAADDDKIYGTIAANAPWRYKGRAIWDYVSKHSNVAHAIQYEKLVAKISFSNAGFAPESAEIYGELAGDFWGQMCFESFIAIARTGIKSASALKNGEAFSEGDIIAGSGAGNLKGINGGSKTKAEKFEADLVNMSSNDRVAIVKQKAKEVASDRGLVKDNKLSKINKRDVYRDPKTNELYAVDTQHGRFEYLTKKGKHLGEVDFDFQYKGKQDKSGGHDLITK